MPRPKNRIFLVHGTFAENASWIQEDSKIALRIRDALDAETVAFSWSGGNSHSAREAAAAELATLIKEDAQKFPNSVRSIVAHSHGGNVAIRAIRELEEETPTNWLICLGTPFLVCGTTYSRRLAEAMSALVWLMVFGLMLIPVIYLGLIGFYVLAVGDFGLWSSAVVIVLFLASTYLLFKLPNLAVGMLSKMIKKRHSRLAETLGWPCNLKTKLLNYQVAFDEARLVVSFFSKLSGLPRRIWDLGAGAVSKYSLPVLFFSFAMVGIGEYFEFQKDSWIVYSMFPMMLLLLVIILLIPLSLFALASPLIRSHPAGFGWEGLTQHFMYDVYLTRNPEPHWRGCLLNATMDLDAKLARIRHSAFYDNDEVIDGVVARLKT